MSGSCRARSPRALILAFMLALAAGCQSYNFNPVGHCVLQPGSETFPLSSIGTADVLFVIDDSGSMAAEQQRLAANFSAFINNLDKANAERASAGLEPFDFHIAVTTTSVFYNGWVASTCRSDCTGTGNSLVCCLNSTNMPAKQPKACTSDAQCPVTTPLSTCGTNCNGFKGENYCCNQSDGSFPAGPTELIPCAREWCVDNLGNAVRCPCGSLKRHYECTSGVGVNEFPYPRGDYVSAAGNPSVLHFDKSLYPKPVPPATLNAECSTTKPCTGAGEVCVSAISASGAPQFCRQSCEGTGVCPLGFTCVISAGPDACQPTNGGNFTSQQLVNYFAGNPVGTNANVVVGTCGSPQEQGLAAARMAIEKAVAGQQPGPLHDNSKLVLVFIGDEDDCSSPEDRSGGVVLSGFTGQDTCVNDFNTNKKMYETASQFVNYFLSLGRPLAVAFVESFTGSSSQLVNQCGYGSYEACVPGLCCQDNCPSAGTCGTTTELDPTPYCGGQAPGTRFFEAANQFRSGGLKGEDVLTGSVCDGDFAALLDKIANLVKPPTGLSLATLPASGEITVLRIIGADGKTTRLDCGPPAPTLADTTSGEFNWWFTASEESSAWVELGKFVYINPAGTCKANPGETYSAEYIGRLPQPDGCHSDLDCQNALGGNSESWTCYAGVQAGGVCASTSLASGRTGTCLCGDRKTVCPNGTAP